MVVRTKLCGIRSEGDLVAAVGAGAHALGFISGVTHTTEDALAPDAARALVELVPPYISSVLVTHLTEADEILWLARLIGASTIQLHGLVAYDTVRRVVRGAGDRRVTKAIHVTGPEAIQDAQRFTPICHALHLDSRTENRLGGTGLTHDWTISSRIARQAQRSGREVILSGGLRPENVAQAIRVVRPFAVDANSGIEWPDPDVWSTAGESRWMVS